MGTPKTRPRLAAGLLLRPINQRLLRLASWRLLRLVANRRCSAGSMISWSDPTVMCMGGEVKKGRTQTQAAE